MTHPHTTPVPVDTSAPTCPSCGVVAAAETYPDGCGPSWYCYDCLRARTVAASEGVAAERARNRSIAGEELAPNKVQCGHVEMPPHRANGRGLASIGGADVSHDTPNHQPCKS